MTNFIAGREKNTFEKSGCDEIRIHDFLFTKKAAFLRNNKKIEIKYVSILSVKRYLVSLIFMNKKVVRRIYEQDW